MEEEALHEDDIKRNRIRATLSENVVFLVDTHEEMSESWNEEIKCRMDAIKEGTTILSVSLPVDLTCYFFMQLFQLL
jgi:hypothetical protein